MLHRRDLLAGVVSLTAASRLAYATGATPELVDAARKEGSVTWYIAQVDTETAEAMGRSFSAKHPGVAVSVIRTTGQVAYERLLQDLKNSAPQSAAAPASGRLR
jgi:iron(III) transport system substrate-binding protein